MECIIIKTFKMYRDTEPQSTVVDLWYASPSIHTFNTKTINI